MSRVPYLIWSPRDAMILSFETAAEGEADALREPARWGLDETIVVSLQRLSEERFNALVAAEDDWRAVAKEWERTNEVLVEHIDLATGAFERAAWVETDADRPIPEQLEQAWMATQNIEGSWSKPATFPDADGTTIENRDFNPRVTRIAPFPVVDGYEYGLRSSMVGDRFTILGERYRVAALGFEKDDDPR